MYTTWGELTVKNVSLIVRVLVVHILCMAMLMPHCSVLAAVEIDVGGVLVVVDDAEDPGPIVLKNPNAEKLKELTGIYDKLDGAHRTLRENGILIHQFYFDSEDEKIHIGVDNLDQTKIEAIEKFIGHSTHVVYYDELPIIPQDNIPNIPQTGGDSNLVLSLCLAALGVIVATVQRKKNKV